MSALAISGTAGQQDTTNNLTPTNATLLSVSPHYTLWRTTHETSSTPEQRHMHGWRPFYYPEYHLIDTEGVARSMIVPDRRLIPPQDEIGALISVGGSILLPDKTLLLSADDRRLGGGSNNLVLLTFEEDVRKLSVVRIDIKPIWKEVLLDGDLNMKGIRVPTRYSTNQVGYEMFVRGSDTQRVAVIPLYDVPDTRSVRKWRYESSEKWPILKVNPESATVWNGQEWYTSPFQPVANLPVDNDRNANNRH